MNHFEYFYPCSFGKKKGRKRLPDVMIEDGLSTFSRFRDGWPRPCVCVCVCVCDNLHFAKAKIKNDLNPNVRVWYGFEQAERLCYLYGLLAFALWTRLILFYHYITYNNFALHFCNIRIGQRKTSSTRQKHNMIFVPIERMEKVRSHTTTNKYTVAPFYIIWFVESSTLLCIKSVLYYFFFYPILKILQAQGQVERESVRVL